MAADSSLVARTAWLMLMARHMDRRQAAQRLRTIQMTCRLAIRLRPREAIEDAREQLERVAIEIEPESDPALQQLLDEVRAEIEQGT